MAKKKEADKAVFHLVHRGIEFEGRRVEAGPEPVELTDWLPPNVIEHWESTKVISVWEGGDDGNRTEG